MIHIEELLSNLPITHLSFSAVRTFIEDPRNFKKKYIDYIYDDKSPLPLTIGSAYHAGVEEWLRGIGKEDLEARKESALKIAADTVRSKAALTEFGKKRIAKKNVDEYIELGCEVFEDTSSGKSIMYAKLNTESTIIEVSGYLQTYFDLDLGYKPIAIEESIKMPTEDLENPGTEHPVALKGRIDLVAEDAEGKTVCVDHKLMGQKPSTDDDGNYVVDPTMKMQAACYDSLLPHLLGGKRPDYFSFDVMVKGSGEFYQIKFELTDIDRLAWSRLYRSTIYKILVGAMFDDPDVLFTPNPFHMYNKDGWNEYMIDMEYLQENGALRAVEKGEEIEYEAIDL